MEQNEKRPTLYLIGGPNGSGKTTFCNEYLPLADQWQFWDASKLPLELVAHSSTVSIEELHNLYA